MQLGKELTSWTLHSGSIYKTTIQASSLDYFGAVRLIHNLETLIVPRRLTWVQRTNDMSAGTWFYDIDALVSGGSTDLYVWLPNSANPTTTSVLALLLFCFATSEEIWPIFAGESLLDPDIEEWTSSTNPTQYTEEGVGASAFVEQETFAPLVRKGRSSLRLRCTSLLSGAFVGIKQSLTPFIADKHYMVWFEYRTDADLATGLEARLRVSINDGDPATDMTSDGETTTSTVLGFALRPTYGEWRRALFVFRSPSTSGTGAFCLRLHNAGGGASGAGIIHFDNFGFRRVKRYERYAARIGASNFPEYEVASPSHLFGGKSIGLGRLALIDQSADLKRVIASLYSVRKPLTIFVGGVFGNGAILTRDDWRSQFSARTGAPRARDGQISFDLFNSWASTRSQALRNRYRKLDLTTMELAREGAPKRLVFGETSEPIFDGVRVVKDASTGYGHYELLDPEIPVADNIDVGLPTGYAPVVYPNKDMADKNINGYELSTPITSVNIVTNTATVTCSREHGLAASDVIVVSGNSITAFNAQWTVSSITSDTVFVINSTGLGTQSGTGGKLVNQSEWDLINNKTRWRIKKDIRNFKFNKAGEDVGSNLSFHFRIGWVITEENRYLEFNIGGLSTLRAAVATGSYNTGSGLASAIQTAMRAVGDANINVSYGSSKFTIARTGNIELRFGGATGTGLVSGAGGGSLHRDIGFKSQNYASAASHTADEFSFFDTTSRPTKATCDLEGPAWRVAKILQAALRTAVGGGDTTMTVTYSETTHKFTVAKSGGGVLSLVIPSASATFTADALTPKPSWVLLGYNMQGAKNGATSYEADNPVFTDVDADHILRFPSGGYKDNASGTLGGYANSYLDSAPAIANWLLQKNLFVPASSVNASEVKAARDESINTDFAKMFMVVQRTNDSEEAREEDDVFGKLNLLSQIGLVDIQVDGDDIWRFIRHKALVSASITSSSVADPTVITTSSAHGFVTGDVVYITGHLGSTPEIYGEYPVTVLSSTTFSIPVAVTVGGSAGKAVRTTEVRAFTDSDYLAGSWDMWVPDKLIYRDVRIWGDYHPALKMFRTCVDGGVAKDSGAPLKLGAEGLFDLDAFLDKSMITGGVQKLSGYYARLCTKNIPRIVTFAAQTKLIDLLIGDRVKLTRTDVLDPRGSFAGLVFRLLSVKRDYLNGRVTVVAAEDVSIFS